MPTKYSNRTVSIMQSPSLVINTKMTFTVFTILTMLYIEHGLHLPRKNKIKCSVLVLGFYTQKEMKFTGETLHNYSQKKLTRVHKQLQ